MEQTETYQCSFTPLIGNVSLAYLSLPASSFPEVPALHTKRQMCLQRLHTVQYTPKGLTSGKLAMNAPNSLMLIQDIPLWNCIDKLSHCTQTHVHCDSQGAVHCYAVDVSFSFHFHPGDQGLSPVNKIKVNRKIIFNFME